MIGANKATNKNRFCRLGSYVAGAEVPGLQPDPLHMQFSGFTSELSDVLHSIKMTARAPGPVSDIARVVAIYGLVPAPCILFSFSDESEVIHFFKVLGIGRRLLKKCIKPILCS